MKGIPRPMAEEQGERLGKGSAADLLSAWRAAERDHAAAIENAGSADLALVAADKAAHAARETAAAAKLSLEAAQRAERAARETADAADLLTRTAVRDQTDADTAVRDTAAAEATAKAEFQDAQRKGFPQGR